MSNRKWAALVAAACVGAIAVSGVRAQDRYLEIAAKNGRANVIHEAVVLPDGDGAGAVVTFRVPNSLLVFVQERDGFVSEADVTVELYRNERKVNDRIWRKKHRAETFDATQSRTDDLKGWIRFAVEPGDYSYRLIVGSEVEDVRSSSGAFHVPDFGREVMGALTFAELRLDSQHVALEPTVLGGDVPFGQDVQAIVPFTIRNTATSVDEFDDPGGSNEPGRTVLTYRLYRISPARDERAARRGRFATRDGRSTPRDPVEIGKDDELVSSGTVSSDRFLPVGTLLESDEDCICWSRSEDAHAHLAVIPIRTGRLESGTYALTVAHGEAESSETYSFSTLWREMPLSLYDVEVAIRHLEFIESRETVRSLLRGSRAMRVEAFESYWKQRDPTPETVLNELMFEYYRRIDFAALEFRTGQHPFPDGLRTDAARIYIVYGAPDDVTNTLPSSGGVEQTWTYADGRRFIFWAASSLAPLELRERDAPN